MADDDEPVDFFGQWTIKSVSRTVRDTATLAARKEGLTVGQWLEVRVREWTDAGSPVTIPAPPPGSELDQLERAIAASIALANAQNLPAGFRTKAARLLKQALPDPTPPARRRIKALPAPDPADPEASNGITNQLLA